MNFKKLFIYSGLFLLAVFALFYNLNDRLLWGDEAETALLAQNILKFGVPKATDGRNYITLFGRETDSNQAQVWTWSPWFDEYIAAGSFYLFDKSTFSARFPFALIGLLSLLFLSLTVHKIYHNHEITFFTLFLCVTNLGLLLHCRQCRYYSVVLFSQVWLIYGYHRLVQKYPKSAIIHIVLSLTVQFYCNYIIVLGNIAALCISTVIALRKDKNLLRYLIICLISFAILATPWILYSQPWKQTKQISLQYFKIRILFYILDMHFYIIPLVLFLIPVFAILWKRYIKNFESAKPQAAKLTEMFLWFLLPIHLIILSVIPGSFFRYILPLVPVLMILAVSTVVYNIKYRIIRYILLIILALSNVIAYYSGYPFRSRIKVGMPIVKFIREITTGYEDRLEDVVKFFTENGNPNQSVLVFDPEFPLIFYTDMRIIDARFIEGINMLDLPDWIMSESASGILYNQPISLLEPIQKYYKAVTLTVHNSHRNGCRPEPALHASFTTTESVPLVIYKKLP